LSSSAERVPIKEALQFLELSRDGNDVEVTVMLGGLDGELTGLSSLDLQYWD
jgi:hypothetical protein